MARRSSWYISSEVYHDAGRARTDEFSEDASFLLLVEGPPSPRYPRKGSMVKCGDGMGSRRRVGDRIEECSKEDFKRLCGNGVKHVVCGRSRLLTAFLFYHLPAPGGMLAQIAYGKAVLAALGRRCCVSITARNTPWGMLVRSRSPTRTCYATGGLSTRRGRSSTTLLCKLVRGGDRAWIHFAVLCL
jgi:hypothetical protein